MRTLILLLACTAACDRAPVKGGAIQFTASGEALAFGGYGFPPSGDAPAFVDGWQIDFDALLVTVDKVALYDNPDKSPSDASLTGAKVAEVRGPWAIDLHPLGALPGKGGGDETAVPFATLDKQNLNHDAPLDETLRYAFGFDLVAASAGAVRVNLSAAAEADYQEMIARGYTVLYVGTARWRGAMGQGAACTTSAPFAAPLPTTVKFRLGFKSPTTYLNCQNSDLSGAPISGEEEYPRGLQVKPNATTTAQVTLHTDHPFWQSVLHDSPLHFDHLAAQATCGAAGCTVTLEDLIGVSFMALGDRAGNPLPWRNCVGADFTPPAGARMRLDAQSYTYAPGGDATQGFRDLYDFVTFNQSTQGHLNADGLCVVQHHFLAPE